MRNFFLASCIYASLAFTHSIPSISPRASSSIIATQCTNHQFRGDWFIAACLTGEDSTTRIQSAVYLPNKIENNDGELQWKPEGWYIRGHCENCGLRNGGASLFCRCGTTWHSKKNVSYWESTINLDEHISVYNGHLLSNLTGPPIIPSAPSKYPVPDSFEHSFGGRATCPDATGPGTDWCNQANTCTSNSDATDSKDSIFFQDFPRTCWVPVVYFPYHWQFKELKLVGHGAWELLAYADEDCSGAPLGRIGPEDLGVCKAYGVNVRAVTARPAFNGDPR